MIACWDAATRLPTYDFFNWLVFVKLLGATEITFAIDPQRFKMNKYWPVSETLKRLDNYIRPGPALIGLPSRDGEDGDRNVGNHYVQDLWAAIRHAKREMPRLTSVLPPTNANYTVTIRNTWYKPERNSDLDLWREFAARIGAVVIHDYEDAPMKLHDRIALYAGARANFGVPNGPLSMLLWTPYQMSMFCDPELTATDWERQGIYAGAQIPWALPSQRLIWEKPTMTTLMQEFERVT